MVKLIDISIILVLFLQVVIFNFLNISSYGIKVICFLILLRLIVVTLKTGRIYTDIVVDFGCVMLIFMIGYISAKVGREYHLDVFMSNFLAIIYTLMPMVYISYIIKHNSDLLFLIIQKSIGLINLCLIANIVVACVQVKVEGFMEGISTWSNPMREDLICGLMGYSSTPQFGLFLCFVILLDLYYSDYCCYNRKYKNIMRGYILFLILFTIIISGINDNKAVYLELPVLIFYYFYITNRMNLSRKKVSRVLFKVIASAIVLILIGIGMYCFIPSVHSAIYNKFGYALTLFVKALETDEVLGYGSADRIYMVIYAFKKYNALKLGYGMGAYTWHAGDVLGFRHFGQADFGALLCLSGLFFTMVVFFELFRKCIMIVCDKEKNYFDKGYLFFLLLFMLFYTQMVTDNTIGIIMLFCLTVFGVTARKKERGDQL
ncbi:MAG: hypothetical protein PUG00_07525 [Clostridiales bacterium]|nr:hypothetical protein [Clostridiales bacterium]